MKRIVFLILLTVVLTSCYPPRIIYSIENIQPLMQKDSIDVRLVEGSTITTGDASSLFSNLYLEISNKRESNILINPNSILELRTDSSVLKYDISPDSLIYQLGRNDKKLLHLSFQTTDCEYVAYETIEFPSIWSFRTLKLDNPQHKLYLLLDLYDDKGEKIEKYVVLKPTGTKRMKYENPPF